MTASPVGIPFFSTVARSASITLPRRHSSTKAASAAAGAAWSDYRQGFGRPASPYGASKLAGEQEVRAWTIKRGTKAPQAAGKIHSDFERGFIRAEVVAFHDLKNCGSHAAAREKGLVRSEGKDYVMHDGDVVLFRFNV